MTTVQEKQAFVRELVDGVCESIIGKIPEMPEDWDGFELRQYVAECFDREKVLTKRDHCNRFRAYRYFVNNKL